MSATVARVTTLGPHPRRYRPGKHRPAQVSLPGGVMNGSEDLYARTVLDVRLNAGHIVYWGFEQFKFRLGCGAWYTPDFFVVTDQGRVEIHEYKGHWEIAARVRIKAAASAFPWFQFIAIQKPRGLRNYEFETIKSHHSYTSDLLCEATREGEPRATDLST